MREGLAFVRQSPVVLGCMALDMFAVILGGATALLPVYANEILAGRPARLRAAHLGARDRRARDVACCCCCARRSSARARRCSSRSRSTGSRRIGFGLSRSFPLSVALYMLAGAADQVSVVLRATAIQLTTPDALRGRVSAVNMIFIAASNQLGAVESGFLAAATSADLRGRVRRHRLPARRRVHGLEAARAAPLPAGYAG